MFLQLIYKRFYSTVAANDKCSLFSDRNLINRRNVKADAHHAYAPNKQMFLLAVKARIVASAMKVMGLEELDGKTIKHVHLRNLASQIVDRFIVDDQSYNAIINHALEDNERQELRRAEMTADGRFLCRHDGCNKTFRYYL